MPEEPKQLKVLLVDDHQMFIDGLQTIIKKSSQYRVVGIALNGSEAIEILKTLPVDIVITDINMPEVSGTELTKTIKLEWPDIKVLILSMYDDREIIHEIIVSEAEGFILKNAGKQELMKALGRLADGGTYYSNEVMDIITENYISKQKTIEETKSLTQRELEILKLVCQEYSTPEIGEILSISPLTVETHRKNILRKTKNKTIVGLIKFAIEHNLT
jgi:DNA-binding NarL/FixJ family response regulator